MGAWGRSLSHAHASTSGCSLKRRPPPPPPLARVRRRCLAASRRAGGGAAAPAPDSFEAFAPFDAAVAASKASDDEDEDGDDEDYASDGDEGAVFAADSDDAGTPSRTSAADLDVWTFPPDPPGHRSGFVAIVGRPNAGKSTLLNALLGQRLSIVTPKAQTTRHRVLGVLSEPGFQAAFLDTPGVVRTARDALEDRMMAAVQGALRDADAVLAVVDASLDGPGDREAALAMVAQPEPVGDGGEAGAAGGAAHAGPPLAIVLNKCDLLPPGGARELAAWFAAAAPRAAVLCAAAAAGGGVRAVADWVGAALPEGPAYYPRGLVAEQPERFFVAEIIRQHVFERYRQEIPYSVAVEVDEFVERGGGGRGGGGGGAGSGGGGAGGGGAQRKDYIAASVVVDAERLKGILVGAHGAAIKALSAAARADVEEFLQRPVFLQLTVRVVKGWRKDARALERLGY